MYSMAQQASPNVMGQRELAWAQLKSLSTVVVRMSSAPVLPVSRTSGGEPQSSASSAKNESPQGNTLGRRDTAAHPQAPDFTIAPQAYQSRWPQASGVH